MPSDTVRVTIMPTKGELQAFERLARLSGETLENWILKTLCETVLNKAEDQPHSRRPDLDSLLVRARDLKK